jgi:hypothetical protein
MPSQAEMTGLERTLGEDTIVDALLSQDGDETLSERIPIRMLYALADGEGELPMDDLNMALRAEPALRATYRRMLRTLTSHYFPAVRAAGTEWAPHREIAGCQIDLGEDDGQLFVIIELSAEITQAPKSLTVINESGIGRRVALPEALRGVIHFPIVEDAELVMLLRDPGSEVYLA